MAFLLLAVSAILGICWATFTAPFQGPDEIAHTAYLQNLAEASARVGVVVTEEGKARARRRLAAAEEGWTPERRNAERAKLGLPARAA